MARHPDPPDPPGPPDPPDLTLDAFIEAQVARTVEPYRDILSAEALSELEDFLTAALTAHPVGAQLVARARPRAEVDRSGEDALDASAASQAREADDPEARGGRR